MFLPKECPGVGPTPQGTLHVQAGPPGSPGTHHESMLFSERYDPRAFLVGSLTCPLNLPLDQNRQCDERLLHGDRDHLTVSRARGLPVMLLEWGQSPGL